MTDRSALHLRFMCCGVGVLALPQTLVVRAAANRTRLPGRELRSSATARSSRLRPSVNLLPCCAGTTSVEDEIAANALRRAVLTTIAHSSWFLKLLQIHTSPDAAMRTFFSMSRLSLVVVLGSGSGALLASCGGDEAQGSLAEPSPTAFDPTIYGPTDAPRPTDPNSFGDAMPPELPEATSAHVRVSELGATSARVQISITPDLNTPAGGNDPARSRVVLQLSGGWPGTPTPISLGLSGSPSWWNGFFTSGTVSMGADGTGTSFVYPMGNAEVSRLLLQIDRIEADAPLLRLSFGLADSYYVGQVVADGSAPTPAATAWATMEGVPSIECSVLPNPDTHIAGDMATLVGDPQFQTAFCRGAVEAAGLSAFLP